MSDDTLRDIRHARSVVDAAADVDSRDARSLAILGYRFGAVSSAVARGDRDALTTALRGIDALSLEWLSHLAREDAA